MDHLSGKHIKGYFCIRFCDGFLFGTAVVWRPACGPYEPYFMGTTELRLDITDEQRSAFQDMIDVGIIKKNSVILVTYSEFCDISGFEQQFAAKLVEVHEWDVKP